MYFLLHKIIIAFFQFRIIVIIAFFIQLTNILLKECPKEYPIKINEECTNNCSEAIYKSTKCIIDNSIIKTQFPNDIIAVGYITIRYTNFISFSNNDMLFQTSSYPIDNKTRIFYGLKSNGRPYFQDKDNGLETPFYSIESINYKYESGNAIFIKDEIEYFVSFGRIDSYTELFDYKNNCLISNRTNNLIGIKNHNLRSNYIKVGINTYILSGLNKNLYPAII